MSRTSAAIRRLGVPSLAAVTLLAGVPALIGAAQASHSGQATVITITPPSDSAAAGTCNIYRLDAFGNNASSANNTTPAESTIIDVELSERLQSNTQDVDFCTASTGNPNPANPSGTAGTSTAPAAPSNETDAGVTGGTDRAEFVTGSDGRVFFGIVGNEAGTVDIRAFADQNNDNTRQPTEPQDFAVKVFTAGGTDNVNCVNAVPESDINVLGETHTIFAFLSNNITTTFNNSAGDSTTTGTSTNNGNVSNVDELSPNNTGPANAGNGTQGSGSCAGDAVSGVTPTAVITSSTDASGGAVTARNTPITCDASDNNGFARCTYTSTTAGTDTIRVFVNQSQGNNATFEAGEPSDVVTKTWRDAPAGRAVNLTCAQETGTTASPQTTQTSAEDCVNQTNDRDRQFTATVDNTDTASTTETSGTLVRFTVTGGSGDEFVTPAGANNLERGTGECSTTDDDQLNTNANVSNTQSSCTVTVTDPTPVSGQVLTVTATIRGTTQSDSGTLTFRNTPRDARNIDLKPDTTTATSGGAALVLTATVVDADGRGVQGVSVTFTENGTGAFRENTSPVQRTTDANGQATVELLAGSGDQGSNQVTATISTASTQCTFAANQGTDPQGTDNSPTNPAPAGNCSDTSSVTFGPPQTPPPATASQTVTAPPPSASGTPTPPQTACTVATTISVNPSTITATSSSQVVVQASPNSIVRLFAYSRPNTTYREVRIAEAGGDGRTEFNVVPPTNTRLYAQQDGCTASPSTVINVRSVVGIHAIRNGVRNYTFTGSTLPRRPGQLVNLYRITSSGAQVLTGQARTDASGRWTITRQFSGSGRFGFIARTGTDLINAAGTSRVRPTLIY